MINASSKAQWQQLKPWALDMGRREQSCRNQNAPVKLLVRKHEIWVIANECCELCFYPSLETVCLELVREGKGSLTQDKRMPCVLSWDFFSPILLFSSLTSQGTNSWLCCAFIFIYLYLSDTPWHHRNHGWLDPSCCWVTMLDWDSCPWCSSRYALAFIYLIYLLFELAYLVKNLS